MNRTKAKTSAGLSVIAVAAVFSLMFMNPTQATEFITGGSLSSMRMAANCKIDNQAMVRCMQ